MRNAITCPGRDAAFFMPLRRTGTVPDAGVRYGPGSAAHRSARATRCTASGARSPMRARLNLQLVAALEVQNLARLVRCRHLKPEAFDDLARQGHLLRIGRGHP